MKDMILFPEYIERLNSVLGPLVAKAKLLLAVCINRDGRVLTHQGSLDKVDIVSLAALVAGNTASTLAIANLVGETEFSTMYHQGKDKNIYIDAIDDNTFLSVVFDDQSNVDRVKVFIRQFERQLKEALKLVYDKDEDQIDLDLDMSGGSFQYLPPEGQLPMTPEQYQLALQYPSQQNANPQQQQYYQETPPGQPTPEHYEQSGQENAMLFIQNKRRQNPPRTD
jgi:predicted regulator of Ras-like GTPase activity (Roadblock/LC7/MglB family)